MGANGLDAFDKTPHATRARLADLMRREAIGPGQQATWPVVGAGLRTVVILGCWPSRLISARSARSA
ncbi:hypothetical protein [Methylobacterium sp. SI9]|uniref:hypothetical protein n=1 Tax=Methylobacterium guangdongense TaxID=3138811 RepID=UPI00313B7817